MDTGTIVGLGAAGSIVLFSSIYASVRKKEDSERRYIEEMGRGVIVICVAMIPFFLLGLMAYVVIFLGV